MPAPTNWRQVIEAMGTDVVTVESLGERIGMNYGKSYERIKAMVRDGVCEVVSKGGSGRPSRYRLCVPADRAIAVMTPDDAESEAWTVSELERAWPARIGRGDVSQQEAVWQA